MNSIYSYITTNLVNEPAAFHLKHTIKNKLSNISTFPNVYALISSLIDDVSEEFSRQWRLFQNVRFLAHLFLGKAKF